MSVIIDCLGECVNTRVALLKLSLICSIGLVNLLTQLRAIVEAYILYQLAINPQRLAADEGLTLVWAATLHGVGVRVESDCMAIDDNANRLSLDASLRDIVSSSHYRISYVG